MRKKIIYSVFIVLAFLTAIETSAETVICEPDCPETPFLDQYPLTCEFQIGNCTFVADYFIRKACRVYCDILLSRVRCIDPPPVINMV